MILRRKEVGNPVDYFDKTFAEYKTGFESRGVLITQLINHITGNTLDINHMSGTLL